MSLTSKYRTFIWDFDGTLYDTYPQTVKAYLDVLGEYGLKESAAVIERVARVSLGDLERYLRGKFDVQSDFFEKVARRAEELVLSFSVPFPDARRFTADVVSDGGQNMLFTHRDDKALLMLERSGIAEFFCDSVVAADPDFEWKPSPKAILALIGRNKADPAEAIMVGDREIDILSAANAGIDSCLIMPYDITADTSATYKCGSFDAFRAALKETAV